MSSCWPRNANRLVVRWTIGNVRARGFEMLRISLACAYRLFGPEAMYVVCVNTIPVPEARERTGALLFEPEWREVTRADIPDVLRNYFDDGLIEGMGWKLMPLRTYPDRYELALDNDCILWQLPEAMYHWLQSDDACLFAEDVDRCLGQFDSLCPPGAFNAGIRGLPPGRDLSQALQQVMKELESSGARFLSGEIEEQGLQAAAIWRMGRVLLVSPREVSLCSPFWPRSPELGCCGAHFVGMNAEHIAWNYFDRPADDWLRDHWLRHRPTLYARANLDSD